MPLPHALRALDHRDFRRFYVAQLLALVGGWMQAVAQAWLVLQLTDSPFRLGLISTLQFSPILVFSVVTGAVADRLPKRALLVATQTTLACQALLLGALVATGRVEYWHVAALGLALGFANVLDQPARQSFVMEMVGKGDVANAVALNSAAFNAARIVGPAVAGVLIAQVGVVAGALTVGGRGSREPGPGRMFRSAALAFAALGGLGLTHHVWMATPLLIVTGYFGIVLMASCNTSMQLGAPDALRGRVMSLYTWVTGGVFPIGAFLVGSISQAWGVSVAFLWNGTLGLLALGGRMLWWRRRARALLGA